MSALCAVDLEPGSIVDPSDLIFSIQKIIAFVSQGTTLPAGTIIITG